MPRSSSVRRTCQGAPGVTCSPAMKPSLSQRSRVDGAICSLRAAAVTLSSSPSAGSLPLGWWQGMCQWVLSEATLLAVKDIPRAVVRGQPPDQVDGVLAGAYLGLRAAQRDSQLADRAAFPPQDQAGVRVRVVAAGGDVDLIEQGAQQLLAVLIGGKAAR